LSGKASDPDEFGHASIFALCSPFVKYDSTVAFATCNVLTIKEFQQRDGVLSGNAVQFLKSGTANLVPARTAKMPRSASMAEE